MPLLLLTFLWLLVSSAPLAAQASETFVDAAAREHVRLARERRQTADVSVASYRALSRERLSLGLRGIRRDRLIYRREVAGRLEWTRSGPARIEIQGAREMVPVAVKGIQLPDDLTSFMPHLAFDPADNRMLLGWDDDGFVRHPLAPDGEEHYRYRTGSTTSIQLQDGRLIRLIELEVIPRRADPHLINGSFWLDAETHAVVQASFRLARRIDLLRDLDDPDDDDDIPGFLRNTTAELDYVTIDYGLYHLHWWMPRLIAFEGVVRVGPARMQLLYERTYSDYEIVGTPTAEAMPMAEMMRRDSVQRLQQERCDGRMQVRVKMGTAAADSTDATSEVTNSGTCGRWTVVMSTDTAAILNSALLPADAFAANEQLLTQEDLRALRDHLKDLPGGPNMLGQPELRASLLDPGMLRYNRIEGLSLGSSASVDFGQHLINGNARIGLADLQPNFELAIARRGAGTSLSLTGYRRLNPTDPWARPFSLGSSLSSLVLGRDEAHFYRSAGIELRGGPAGAAASWYSWRLYAQRESGAEVETDFNLRRLLGNNSRFSPNIVADELNALGAEATFRYQHGLDPAGFRYGAELYANGAGGTQTFGRGALTLRFGIPLPGRFHAATEYAAGTSVKSLPVQHHWYLGGPSSLRGYNADVMIGESFWRGRAEIGYGLPAIRIIGFTDVGWAGAKHTFSKSKPLKSAGGGVSILDGLIRLDIAHGLRAPKGWTASFYLDAAL